MQEEGVEDEAGREHEGDLPYETRQPARYGKGDEVVWTVGEGCPDVEAGGEEQAPEDDGRGADEGGEGDEEEGPDYETAYGAGDLVRHELLSGRWEDQATYSVGNDLRRATKGLGLDGRVHEC